MTQMSERQIAELDARDFLEEDTWKRWKQMYDECMAYRKTLKGKPTEEQREQLAANNMWIEFCDHILWHSARLAAHNRCRCSKCTQARQAKSIT